MPLPTKIGITEEERKKQETAELDEKFGLPETWSRHTQQRTKTDQCAVCEDTFTMVAMFGVGNRDFFCKQCGLAVCGPCSANKKYLSKQADEKFRVCDLCDTKIDNIKLRNTYDKFVELKEQKIEMMSELIEIRKKHLDELCEKTVAQEEVLRRELDKVEAALAVQEENTKHLEQ